MPLVSGILKFSNAAANIQTDINILTPGHFSHYIADNADHNVRTLDGHGTFHGMGIIMAATPGIKQKLVVPKFQSSETLSSKIKPDYCTAVPLVDILEQIIHFGIIIPLLKKKLGEETCHVLPFLLVISGCDTTSRLFGIGKSSVIKKATNDKSFLITNKHFAQFRIQQLFIQQARTLLSVTMEEDTVIH